METREIARSEWKTFFERFSKAHEGSPATLRILSSATGAQIEGWELPFEGISPDRREGVPITIDLGRDPNDRVEHQVAAPTRVWTQVAEDGKEIALEIESSDATKTILEFPTK